MRIGIIGAGFAGLSAAYDLARAGHTVTVFDGMSQPGGLAAGFQDARWDWPLEHFYHHIFTSDTDIIDLAKETGGADLLLVRRPTTAQFVAGKPYALDGVLPVLGFSPLPVLDRLRLGLAVAYLKVTRNWHALETIPAQTWLRRWMGDAAYREIWEPLLMGKFGDRHREVPMSWLWARLHKRSARLMYFKGGFQGFANHLQQVVTGLGVDVRLNTPVQVIRRGADGATAAGGRANMGASAGAGGQAETGGRVDAGGTAQPAAAADAYPLVIRAGEVELGFDRVIATVGPHLFARMVPELPADYLAELHQLPYLGAVVGVLAIDRKLMDSVYWLSMDKREFPFLACVEHTNFMDPAHYGGDRLVYLGDYLKTDHRYFSMPDDAVLEEWMAALTRINPAFDRSWVRKTWLFRANYAQPVVPLGFSKHIPPLQTPIPGLFLASMSQVYPWDRGTNYAVEIGRKVARAVMGTG